MESESLNDLVGVAYVPYKASPQAGFDCYTLMLEVGRRLELNFPEIDYSLDESLRDELISHHAAAFQRVENPGFGDVVVIRSVAFATHLGVMLNRYKFIHTTRDTGCIISRTDTPRYSSRIEGFYRCIR